MERPPHPAAAVFFTADLRYAIAGRIFVMPDPRFFETGSPLGIAEIINVTGASLICGDESRKINRVAAHDEADLDSAVIYCMKAEQFAGLETKPFGLCLVSDKLAELAPKNGAVAVVNSPRLAFAQIADRLHKSKPLSDRAKNFDASISIDETSVISATAKIGAGAQIGPHVYIGPGVEIGEGAQIDASVSILCALIGKNVAILPGAKIGQAGFGFVEGAGGLARVPQLGRVVIGNDVEIGANTTIDRGALSDTVIGDGTKIDNLVQIGHNVRIGRNCVIAAQTGISGSCIIGDGVFMGGQVGLSDHLTIGAGARIAAGSGLMRDVPAGEAWGGSPAKPVKEWLRETAALGKLTKKKSD